MRLAVPSLLVLATTVAVAQAPTFGAPVRLQAGEKFLGEKRLYPSPVYHDVNGDGLADIVVGDLPGRLTIALRKPGSGQPAYEPETKMNDVDGKEIYFHNW